MTMRDTDVINILAPQRGDHRSLAVAMGICPSVLSNWKTRGIPAAWRPTIWALLEERCPDVAARLDRDDFLGVRLLRRGAA